MTQVVKTRFEAEVAGYVNNIRKASLATKDFSKQAVKDFAASREEWSAFAGDILKGSAAIGAGVAIAVKKFADFEQSMSGVKAVSGATAAEMAQLEQAAIDLGASTMFSASEVASAQEELVKAGISTSDVLGGALKGSLDLAAAGNLDLASAATVSAQAMNLFNLQGKDVSHIADVLAAGANKSSADVTDLAQAMQQAGTVASQTGMSLEETVAALSMFADQGIRGSDAGTSLKTMLQRLTPQSKEAQKEMARLGFSAFDAQGNFIGLEGLSRELQESFGGLDTQSRNAALGMVFGADAIRGASILMEGGAEAAREYTKAVDDSGAAAEVAATRMDNLKGDLEELSGAFETLMIQGGSGVGDALRDVVQALTGVVEGFSNLPPWVQESTVKLALFTAAAGLMVGGGIKVATTVAGLVTQFKALKTTAPGAAAALTSVAKAGAALAVLGIMAEISDNIDEWTRRNDDLDKFAKSMRGVGDAAEFMQQRVTWMTQSGLFNQEEFISGAEALDRLAESAQIAFGDTLEDTIGRWQNPGSFERFIEKAQGLDAALAQLVRSGNAEAANEIFEKFVASAMAAEGVTYDEIIQGFTEYEAASKDAAGATEEVLAAAQAWDNATFPDLNQPITDNERLAESYAQTAEEAEAARKALQDYMATISGGSSAFSTLSSVFSNVEEDAKAWAQAQADAYNKAQEDSERATRAAEEAARAATEHARKQEDAARKVADARRDRVRVEERAAESIESALRRQEDAEASLERAQRNAADAQKALTQARKDAAEQLVDMRSRVARGEIAEREAELSITEAERRIRELARDPKATATERERAKLALERAKLDLEDLRRDNRKLQEEARDTAKKGVEGSDLVVKAKERIVEATENQRDAEQNLVDAQREVTKARTRAAEDIADAEQKITDALRDQTEVMSSWEASTKTHTERASKSWEDFVDQYEIDAARYKKQLKDQIKDQEEWGKNLLSLAGRVPDGMLAELAAMGPEAAPLIASLAKTNDKELSEIAGLWYQAGTKMPQELARGVKAKQVLATAVAQRLGQGMVNEVLSRVESGELTIAEAIEEYDLQATVEVMAETDPAAEDVLAWIDGVERTPVIARVGADTGAALGSVNTWERDTQRRRPTPSVDANVKPAKGAADSWHRNTELLKPIVKVGADTTVADKDMQVFYDSWDNKDFRVRIIANTGADTGASIGTTKRADGGFDQAGRYVPRVSQFGGPQFGKTNVMWGEPETGWEAYISGKPSQRDRNIGILEKAARMLGVDVVRYANGSTVNMPWNMDVRLGGSVPKAILSEVTSESRKWAAAQQRMGGIAEALAGVSRASGDWRSLWSMVRPFGVSLFSSERPGAITATGFPSKHAVGKAIDVSPNKRLWDYLEPRRHAFAELYGPWGLWLRGQNRWNYPGAAITAKNHKDHIHLATYMDGMFRNGLKKADTGNLTLNPGWNAVYNGLGRLEHLAEQRPASPSGTVTAVLDPEDRALLREFTNTVPEVVLYAEDREIARSSVRGSAHLRHRITTSQRTRLGRR